MYIQHIQVKNFRCFESFSLAIEKPVILISGENGSGKSSLLEAIHYGCYLRSFRTHLPRELIHFHDENFFIKLQVQTESYAYDLQVGFSGKKRLVRIDQKIITSYKDLSQLYRIITITEDDLAMIKGGPEIRRLFIDQALSLQSADFLGHMKKYKHILENRNALLYKGIQQQDLFMIVTQQLWEQSRVIQDYRIRFLHELQKRTNILLGQWFDEPITIDLAYQPKKATQETFETFTTQKELFFLEQKYGRSLFGAHLDDIAIQFCHKMSRTFASRGQQKLILMLIKIAQMQLLITEANSGIFLLDDFMTDFDQKKSKIILNILHNFNIQLFFTSPSAHGTLEDLLLSYDTQHIKLTM